MRMKLTAHSANSCTIEYSDPVTDIRQSRTFIVIGHYVHEVFTRHTKQVCSYLQLAGNSLMCDPAKQDFHALIRREYQRMRRADLRHMAR